MSDKINKFLIEAGMMLDTANRIRDIQTQIELRKENLDKIREDSYIGELPIYKTSYGFHKFYVDEELSKTLIEQYVAFNEYKIQELIKKLEEIEKEL